MLKLKSLLIQNRIGIVLPPSIFINNLPFEIRHVERSVQNSAF